MAREKLLAVQRQDVILEMVKKDGFVTVTGLALQCGVSEMTVRRDLDILGEKNILARTHGGAVLPTRLRGRDVDLVEPSVNRRSSFNHQAKVSIARRALEIIGTNQSIAIDIGTTTYELAELLNNQPLSVFTNSLKIAEQLCQSRTNVYVPGGRVSGREPSIVGSQAIDYLQRFNFDIAFIGVSGMTTDGFFDYSLEDTEIKKALITRSRQRVVLLDSSKFDRLSVVLVSKLAEIDILITDIPPPENLGRALEKAGVLVEIGIGDAGT